MSYIHGQAWRKDCWLLGLAYHYLQEWKAVPPSLLSSLTCQAPGCSAMQVHQQRGRCSTQLGIGLAGAPVKSAGPWTSLPALPGSAVPCKPSCTMGSHAVVGAHSPPSGVPHRNMQHLPPAARHIQTMHGNPKSF